MTYFIFLIKTRYNLEPNKIWTNSLGSTKLKLHIFKVAIKMWKKKKKRRTTWTLTRPARSNHSAHSHLLPARTDSGSRWLEGQRAREGEDDGKACRRRGFRRGGWHLRDLYDEPHRRVVKMGAQNYRSWPTGGNGGMAALLDGALAISGR
jgi:hypothetical protein